jgi:hypothetical protein
LRHGAAITSIFVDAKFQRRVLKAEQADRAVFVRTRHIGDGGVDHQKGARFRRERVRSTDKKRAVFP